MFLRHGARAPWEDSSDEPQIWKENMRANAMELPPYILQDIESNEEVSSNRLRETTFDHSRPPCTTPSLPASPFCCPPHLTRVVGSGWRAPDRSAYSGRPMASQGARRVLTSLLCGQLSPSRFPARCILLQDGLCTPCVASDFEDRTLEKGACSTHTANWDTTHARTSRCLYGSSIPPLPLPTLPPHPHSPHSRIPLPPGPAPTRWDRAGVADCGPGAPRRKIRRKPRGFF